MNSSENRKLTAVKMLFVGLLAFALGALLNADQLVREAEAKPFGRKRDMSLAVWEPVQSVSDALYLNRPRRWVDDLRNRYPEASESPGAIAPVSTTTTTANASTTTVATTTSTAGSSVDSPASTSTTLPPATSTTTPRLFTPTPDNKLLLWVGGDSMAQVFGDSLVRLSEETGLITASNHSTISSGLTRSDFFDWPARLGEVVAQDDPDVIVVVFGANDVQGIQTPEGDVFKPLSPEWTDEYRSRVAVTMDLLMDDQRLVIWVGQPIMRSRDFSEDLELLNLIYRQEAASRDGIEFVDSWSLFVDGDGGYTDLAESADGRILDLRQNDGVHLTREGGSLLAAAVLELVDRAAGS